MKQRKNQEKKKKKKKEKKRKTKQQQHTQKRCLSLENVLDVVFQFRTMAWRLCNRNGTQTVLSVTSAASPCSSSAWSSTPGPTASTAKRGCTATTVRSATSPSWGNKFTPQESSSIQTTLSAPAVRPLSQEGSWKRTSKSTALLATLRLLPNKTSKTQMIIININNNNKKRQHSFSLFL